jgi:hypothetical protein
MRPARQSLGNGDASKISNRFPGGVKEILE